MDRSFTVSSANSLVWTWSYLTCSHLLLTRLIAKLRRTPPEIPDGWAY